MMREHIETCRFSSPLMGVPIKSGKVRVMDRQEVGKLGEKAARKFLKKRGYRIRETGFRCRHGEIDIIAQKKDWLVFVEVRTKSNLDFGNPEESITQAKKEKLIASDISSRYFFGNSLPPMAAQWLNIEGLCL